MAIAYSPRTVFDCPDPTALAGFYAGILGWKVEGAGDWVQIRSADGQGIISFQQVQDYREPDWPGQIVPQQVHLDLMVRDLEEGQAQALDVGARLAKEQPGGTEFRVFLDPAGHPFCLCAG